MDAERRPFYFGFGERRAFYGGKAALILRERGTRKRSPFTLSLPCEGAGLQEWAGRPFYFGFGEHRAFCGGGGRDVTVFLADAVIY